MKIIKTEDQCEDRCVVGIFDKNIKIVYDGDDVKYGQQFTQFNFCPFCGQELVLTIDEKIIKKTENDK